MEWFRIGRSFFWPGGVIVLFLILFRSPIYDFLNDLGSLKFGGAEAKRRPPDQSEPLKPPLGEPPPEPPSPVTSTGATANEEQTRALAYYWFYEKMYRLLFGTQTGALRYVNIRPAGATRSEVEKFYTEHERRLKASVPGQNPDWDNWISFVTDSGLLRPEGDRYHITPLGTAFIQWMDSEHLGDNPGS